MQCKKVRNKNGFVWECVEDGPRLANGKRNQIRRRGKTQREARMKVSDEIERLEMQGINARLSDTTTFEQLADEWLKVYAASGVKRGSVRIREKEVKVLNKHLAGVPVNKITHHMYQNVLFELDDEEYAYNTISGVNTCANMIFRYAKRNGLINDNPRDDAVIPKKSITVEELENDNIEETYFETDELMDFLNITLTVGLELDKEWFYTLAFSGMRPGELCALKKSDLNFDNNTIRVSKTLYSENNNMREYTLDTTKTNTMRIVEMDNNIMSMLKQLIHNNDVHKLKYRTLIEDYNNEDFVFQRHNGYPFFIKNISDRMRRLLKFSGINKKLTPHSFRHTHISMLTESGAELPTIMERVGHVDPNTTLKVYTHVTNKMKLKSVENLTTFNKELLDKISFQK